MPASSATNTRLFDFRHIFPRYVAAASTPASRLRRCRDACFTAMSGVATLPYARYAARCAPRVDDAATIIRDGPIDDDYRDIDRIQHEAPAVTFRRFDAAHAARGAALRDIDIAALVSPAAAASVAPRAQDEHAPRAQRARAQNIRHDTRAPCRRACLRLMLSLMLLLLLIFFSSLRDDILR